jgi:hypothetical protein
MKKEISSALHLLCAPAIEPDGRAAEWVGAEHERAATPNAAGAVVTDLDWLGARILDVRCITDIVGKAAQ